MKKKVSLFLAAVLMVLFVFGCDGCKISQNPDDYKGTTGMSQIK